MMKIIKLISITILLALITGCGNKLALSELEIEDGIISNWISGTIQNNTNKDYYMVSVDLTLKNGGIKKDCSILISDVKAKETKDFKELILGCDGDLKNYKATVKKIKPYEDTN